MAAPTDKTPPWAVSAEDVGGAIRWVDDNVKPLGAVLDFGRQAAANIASATAGPADSVAQAIDHAAAGFVGVEPDAALAQQLAGSPGAPPPPLPPVPGGTAIDATPPGQQMQPTLPAGPRYGIASTTVTDTKHPIYSKAEAVQRVGAEQAAADAQAVNVRQWASDTGAAMQGQVDELQSQYQQQREQLSSIGAESAGLKNRYDRLDAEFAQAKEDVKDAVPIAGATIPTYSRVLTGLAAIMEGFAAGVNRRKSNAGRLVQSALNRDFQAQRAVYADKLRDMNVTAQQRSEAMRRIDMLDTRKQIVLSRQAQIKAAQVGYQTKSLSVRKQSEDTVFALGQGVRALNDRMEQLSRPQKQSRTTTKKVPLGGGALGGGGGKTLTPKFVDDMNKRLGMLKEGKTLLGELGELKSLTPVDKAFGAVKSTFGGKDPHGTAQARILQWAKAAAKAAGSETGPITKQEADLLLKAAQGNDWDKLQRSARSVAEKLNTGYAGMQNTVRGLSRTHNIGPIAHVLGERGVNAPGSAAKFGGVKQ